MKTKIAILVTILAGSLSVPSLMADVDVNINVNLPVVQMKDEPVMAVIPGTYIYFIYGYEHDFFFYGGYWWRFHHNYWYRANNYNGPWKMRKTKYVPLPLTRIPSDWRKMTVANSGFKYQEVKKNWKQWEKEKRWDKKQDKKEIKQEIREEKQDKKNDKKKNDKDNRKSGKGRK